ncbi:basic blue protein-like [Mangifera indica]|uniref:basic blue protein-like n=1 Tax=Mangifera indica TaxID=29780 RepID=UPI001CF9B777|nr:basic blue protein-like [Mangifera indica]
MVQERGSAIVLTVVLSLVLLQYCEFSEAASYVVGGPGGWTFNVNRWPKGKTFKVGDILVFNYNPSIHNVVAVNKGGYRNCKTSRGAKVFKSGKDQIKLAKGPNYFICSTQGHCQSGMKIAVTAN